MKVQNYSTEIENCEISFFLAGSYELTAGENHTRDIFITSVLRIILPGDNTQGNETGLAYSTNEEKKEANTKC
jgi:hypothetical protein